MYMKCLNHQMTSDNQSKQELSTCLESPCTNNYTMEIIVTSVACFMLLFPLLDSCLVEVDWIVLIILDCYWESFLNMVLEVLATLYILVQSFRVSDRSTTWPANGIYLFLLLKLPYFAIIEKMISLNVNIIIIIMDLPPSRNKLTKMQSAAVAK